jgi:hypothetical protein
MPFASGSLRAAIAASTRKNNTKPPSNATNQAANKTNNNVTPKPTPTTNDNSKETTPPNTTTSETQTTPAPANNKEQPGKTLATKHTKGWTCMIAPNPDGSRVDVIPFIKGFLKALHFIHSPAWIKHHPSATNTTIKITTENDVDTNAATIDQIAEDWRYLSGNKLIMRLHIVTDKPMTELINIPMFKNWMWQHKLQLTISELKTTRPMYAGIFEETLAENKSIHLFKALLDSVHNTKDLFEYQIIVRTLYLPNSKLSTQFYLVLIDSKDKDIVRQTFETSGDKMGIVYLSWIQYENYEVPKKAHIIMKQKEIQDTIRCALLTGFTDSNPIMTLQPETLTTIPTPMEISTETTKLTILDTNPYSTLAMSDDETEDEEQQHLTHQETSNNNNNTNYGKCSDDSTTPDDSTVKQTNMTHKQVPMYNNPSGMDLNDITVADFIYQYYKNSYEEPMFCEVRYPIAGTLQLFYLTKRRYEVEDLLPILRLETARFMTEESIDYAFTDSELIKADLGNDKYWQPFALAKSIPEVDPTILNPYSEQTKQNKRKRRNHHAPRNMPPQYTPSTTYMNNLATIPATIFTAPIDQQHQLRQPQQNSNPSQLTPSANQQPPQDTSPTSTPTIPRTNVENDDALEMRLQQYCKSIVEDSATALTSEIKATNDATLRKIFDTKETLKASISSQLTNLRKETTHQLTQNKVDLETKIDATRQAITEIKLTQTEIQSTHGTMLQKQDNIMTLLENLTQGLQKLQPNLNPTTTPSPTPMEDVHNTSKNKLDSAIITQTQPNKQQKTNKKENIPNYLGWKTLLNYGETQQPPSERAATPSESNESRSERAPLAAKQQ